MKPRCSSESRTLLCASVPPLERGGVRDNDNSVATVRPPERPRRRTQTRGRGAGRPGLIRRVALCRTARPPPYSARQALELRGDQHYARTRPPAPGAAWGAPVPSPAPPDARAHRGGHDPSRAALPDPPDPHNQAVPAWLHRSRWAVQDSKPPANGHLPAVEVCTGVCTPSHESHADSRAARCREGR